MYDTEPLVDENWYPTEHGLSRISDFHGTPNDFVDLISEMWRFPTEITVDSFLNEYSKPVMRVNLRTIGWSGNEDIIGEVEATFFHTLYWIASHRGGHHVYDVPVEMWKSPRWLGRADRGA